MAIQKKRGNLILVGILLLLSVSIIIILLLPIFQNTQEEAENTAPKATFSETTAFDFIEYPFERKHDLPVVSIEMNPKDLWDDEIGIYAEGNGLEANYKKKGHEWKKPAKITFFTEEQKAGFQYDMELRLHGAGTRSNPQKSFKITPKREYGSRSIEYRIFPELPYVEYNGLLIRSAGNDWGHTMFRDALLQSLVKDILDTQASRASVVYLNGEYWGIYNLRPFQDEQYLENRYSVAKNSVVILEPRRDNNGYPQVNAGQEGDELHYVKAIEFAESHNMEIQENYDYLNTQIDIENYMDYVLFQIYIDNPDSFSNNIKYWRYKTEQYNPKAEEGLDGRWRFLVYDVDQGFGGTYTSRSVKGNLLKKLIRPDFRDHSWSNSLLVSLLANEEFKNNFINRYADFLNTRFREEPILEEIEEYKKIIETEIPLFIDRWGGTLDKKDHPCFSSIAEWEENIQVLREAARRRPLETRADFIKYFHLPGTATVNISTNLQGAGSIKINTATYDDFDFSPVYFQGVPITISAKPNKGFKFVRWDVNFDLNTDSPEFVTVFGKGYIDIKTVFAEE